MRRVRVSLEQSGPNEVFFPDGSPRPPYGTLLDELERMGAGGFGERAERAHAKMLEEQRAAGISEGDKTHPTDWFPRVVPAAEWGRIEAGLAQRARAINEFLRRLEAGGGWEKVVPPEVVASSPLYDPATPTRFGDVPARHIGFDLVAVEGEADGSWEYRVIEDNVRMPVGAMTMSRLRGLTPEVFPESYGALGVRPLGDVLGRIGAVARSTSPQPGGRAGAATLAVLSDGPDDQYYLDHALLARSTDAILAEPGEVHLDGDGCFVHAPSGRRVDVVYERLEEGRLWDTLPGLVEAHLEGRVWVFFPPNLGIADDKGVYPFVPEMIRAYLGEEPLIPNVETYSLAVEEDRRYVVDHFDELVIKGRAGWGGKEVTICPFEPREAVEALKRRVEANPVGYVAQSLVDFSTHVLCEPEAGDLLLRDSYADYRVHAVCAAPDDVWIVPGALTRVAAPGKRKVNISGGGVTKDTWVLTQ